MLFKQYHAVRLETVEEENLRIDLPASVHEKIVFSGRTVDKQANSKNFYCVVIVVQ
jgi:hypothetical protein